MNDIKYDSLPSFRVAIMGAAAVGKTAIVNRLVNNSFPVNYEPTMDIERYTSLFNLTEYEVKTKTYVMVTLEDMFGLNNPLLQTPDNLITSNVLKEKRKTMSENFKNIMFTSTEKRTKLSNELKKAKKAPVNKKSNPKDILYEQIFSNDPKIERLGFILVCDCVDPNSGKDLEILIDKLHQIEKTNNLIYPKCIFVNKTDKAVDKETKTKLKTMISELEVFKTKYKLEVFKVSALTNQGIVESFRKFVSKIHQQQVDLKQNEGRDNDNENENDVEFDNNVMCQDRLNSCSKKIFCGTRLFTCGERPDDEDDN